MACYRQTVIRRAYRARVNSTIAAALIAGGISVASFAFNAWTTSRTLRAARVANLRDRQAGVYQQVLAYASHQRESRRNKTRTVRYEAHVEAQLQALLDTYTVPNWFELQANVLAYCPDSVVAAFMAAKEADDAIWAAFSAHKEAVQLNRANPPMADPLRVGVLVADLRLRTEEAELADARLIDVVRDKMLGARPAANRSLVGELTYDMRVRRSMRI